MRELLLLLHFPLVAEIGGEKPKQNDTEKEGIGDFVFILAVFLSSEKEEKRKPQVDLRGKYHITLPITRDHYTHIAWRRN